MYYVYVYLDPRKLGHFCYQNICFFYEPIYVGKGSNYRDSYHLTRKDKHPFTTKLQKIKMAGLLPIIFRISYFDNPAEAYRYEKNLISAVKIKSLGGPLTNLDSGGFGGPTHNDVTKLKISNKLSGTNHPNYNKNLSSDTKFLISTKIKDLWNANILQGSSWSRESKENYSKSRKGIVFSETHKNNISKNNGMRKSWVLQKPNNEIIIVEFLKRFCEENNLSISSLRQAYYTKILLKGKHKGWRIIGNSFIQIKSL